LKNIPVDPCLFPTAKSALGSWIHHVLVVPNYSILSRRQESLAVAVPVQSTKEPMHLVVDSTGLKVYGEGGWKVRKRGWMTRRIWRELHLGVHADTQEIVADQLTPAYLNDAHQLNEENRAKKVRINIFKLCK